MLYGISNNGNNHNGVFKELSADFRNGNFMPYRFRPLAKKEMSGEQELKIRVSVEGKKPTTSTIEQYQIDSYFKMGWKLDLV